MPKNSFERLGKNYYFYVVYEKSTHYPRTKVHNFRVSCARMYPKIYCRHCKKDKSVISRELRRNVNAKTGKYSFSVAQELADLRKERMKIPRKLNVNLKKTSFL